MCQCGAAYQASALRIHNASVWLQFCQVNFLRENVVTTFFRITYRSKLCNILFFFCTNHLLNGSQLSYLHVPAFSNTK